MTIKVLLICESPDENKRKMWFAFYNGNIKLEGQQVRSGPSGAAFSRGFTWSTRT